MGKEMGEGLFHGQSRNILGKAIELFNMFLKIRKVANGIYVRVSASFL